MRLKQKELVGHLLSQGQLTELPWLPVPPQLSRDNLDLGIHSCRWRRDIFTFFQSSLFELFWAKIFSEIMDKLGLKVVNATVMASLLCWSTLD